MNELKQFLKYLVEIKLFPEGYDLDKVVSKYEEYKATSELDNFIMFEVKLTDQFNGFVIREMTERQIANLRIENAVTKMLKSIKVL